MTRSAIATSDQFMGDLDRPGAAQRECLLKRIVNPNRDGEYGRKFGFVGIRSVAEFRSSVPIIRYDDIRSDIERIAHGEQGVLTNEPVRRFFVTSGTTADPKLVPVTAAFLRDKRRVFGFFWGRVFDRHPGARSGSIITNFTDRETGTTTSGGLPCTSESSFWADWTARLRLGGDSGLSRELLQIEDYDSRYYAVARILMEEDVSLLMTLNPSTLVLLLQKMNEFTGDLIADIADGGITARMRIPPDVRERIAAKYKGNPDRAAQLESLSHRDPPLVASSMWPNLKLVACWRSPMLAPYLRMLEPLLGSVPQRDYVSMASEGILAVPLEDGGSGGLLPTSVHFYEFIPEEQIDHNDPDVLLADQLEVDRRYAIVMSTTSGLYRYHIGDVVRVQGFIGRTPLIEFLHRAGSTCSLTGEKLTEEQVVQAVSMCSQRLGLQCTSFAAIPSDDSFPHYVVLVEFDSVPAPDVLRTFLEATDQALAESNVEYASKRASLRLGAPEVWVIAPGGFEAWRRRRVAGGANDDQVKPVHLLRDPSFHDQFEILERIGAG